MKASLSFQMFVEAPRISCQRHRLNLVTFWAKSADNLTAEQGSKYNIHNPNAGLVPRFLPGFLEYVWIEYLSQPLPSHWQPASHCTPVSAITPKPHPTWAQEQGRKRTVNIWNNDGGGGSLLLQRSLKVLYLIYD